MCKSINVHFTFRAYFGGILLKFTMLARGYMSPVKYF